MARSRTKNGGPRRGTFKPKRLGKGWLANRQETVGTRPVLRITEPEAGEPAKGKAGKAAKTAQSKSGQSKDG
jgi:hypothetical protein